MADARNRPNARPDRIKPPIHRKCPHCKKTHVSKGASRPEVKRQGSVPCMLRCYVEEMCKLDLMELARTEGVSLSEIARRALREYLARR